MDTEELMYDLPETLIAQHPPAKRSDARLLVLDRSTGTLHDHVFSDIVTFLRPGDCLVINDTKVRPARFLGRRRTGAGLEGLFLSADAGGTWTVLLKGIRKIQPGEEIVLLDREGQEALTAMIVERRSEGECLLSVHTDQDVETTLNQIGLFPSRKRTPTWLLACEIPVASPASCLPVLNQAETVSPRLIVKRCGPPLAVLPTRSTVIVSRSCCASGHS